MKRFMIMLFFLTTIAALASGCSGGELTVTDSWARPAQAGQNGAVYFVINNQTRQPDTLLAVRGEIADALEVHLSTMDDNGVMAMQRQETVTVPARENVTFEPGGLHVMLIALENDLQSGERFPVTLVFQNAGEILLEVPVRAP